MKKITSTILILFFFVFQSLGGQVLTNIVCPGATSIQWTKTSGNINFQTWDINNVLFNMPSGGSISFNVKATNSSNKTISSRSVTFNNFGSFSVYPNPSQGWIQVDLNPELSFEYNLIDIKELKSVVCSSVPRDGKIDLTSIPPGEYLIKIIYEQKLVGERRIIIKK